MKTNTFAKTLGIVRYLIIVSSISFALILAVEIVFRLYRANTLYRMTSKRIQDTFLASDKEVPISSIKKLLQSHGVLASIEYKEWIEIGNKNHSNEHSEVVNGARKTFFNASPSCHRRKTIWFFGGSTTYGTGVSWDRTLPSYFARMFKPSDCIEVVNYGTPYHYSLQEKLYFVSNLLRGDKRPNIVIFVDGLNDFIQKGSSLKKQSFFTPVIASAIGSNASSIDRTNTPLINLSVIAFLQKKFFNNATSNYIAPPGLTKKQILKDNAHQMVNTSKVLEPICKCSSILCKQYLQPIPALHYSNQPYEDISSLRGQETREDAKLFYAEARSQSEVLSEESFQFYDASKVFEGYPKHSPYVDGFHYSNGGNKVLASFIFSTLKKDLEK